LNTRQAVKDKTGGSTEEKRFEPGWDRNGWTETKKKPPTKAIREKRKRQCFNRSYEKKAKAGPGRRETTLKAGNSRKRGKIQGDRNIADLRHLSNKNGGTVA